MTVDAIESIRATVNFQQDRVDAGTYSHWDPSMTKLKLRPTEIDIINMRSLPVPPALDREGFTVARHAVEGDWTDQDWVQGGYVASCLDLVKELTGARHTLAIYYPLIRNVENREGEYETARFIHMDSPRAEYRALAETIAREQGHELKRGAIYNVWKALSPPPQSQPLAVADRRDVGMEDFVRGMNVAGGSFVEAPFLGVAEPAKPISMYYAPDLRIDESLVFLSADFDPGRPLGCPHTAIVPPVGTAGLVPRKSVEARVIALFD